MRYLSLFSGIEAATQAWQPLGWECVAVSEIEPFPCAVLEHHYPHVPNLGDVTKITEQQIKDLGQIDLIVFGSPCQNLSVAGNRKGFEGEQSSLFYAAMEIIKHAKRHCKTRFALWENVPGAFSSNKGADFTEVVKHMAGLDELDTPTNGWGKEGAAVGSNGLLEWSVLDAQWFGLAQRRKRVFAIVDFGDWSSRPPILLERESCRGEVAPSRGEGKGYATDVKASPAYGVNLKPFEIGESFELVGTLTACCYKDPKGVVKNKKVRRLTPIEYERLQGFSTNFTKIPYRNKPADDCPNGVRYKALGNSMAVNVMAWIGQRVQQAVLTSASEVAA